MTITRVSSEAVNLGEARHAADNGPVVIIEGDKPTYVLLSVDLYRKILGPTLQEMVAMPNGDEIEFEPEKLSDRLFRPIS